MTFNEAGLQLLKNFEGCRLTAYMPTPNDVPTIGYGDTEGVSMGMTITQEEADTRLMNAVTEFSNGVTKLVECPLSDNQFSALVCFAYNVGLGALGASTLLRLLNAGDDDAAAEQFGRWNKQAGQVLAGLTRRREAERELFLTA